MESNANDDCLSVSANRDLKSDSTHPFPYDWKTLQSLADEFIREHLLFEMKRIGGDAAAMWVPDHRDGKDGLMIAVNVGSKGTSIEGVVFQPFGQGLLCAAYSENRIICHQGIFQHRQQSAQVDKQLHQVTAHQIACPLDLFDQRAGAATVIQSSGGEFRTKWGFDQNDIDSFVRAIKVCQRFLEYRCREGSV